MFEGLVLLAALNVPFEHHQPVLPERLLCETPEQALSVIEEILETSAQPDSIPAGCDKRPTDPAWVTGLTYHHTHGQFDVSVVTLRLPNQELRYSFSVSVN